MIVPNLAAQQPLIIWQNPHYDRATRATPRHRVPLTTRRPPLSPYTTQTNSQQGRPHDNIRATTRIAAPQVFASLPRTLRPMQRPRYDGATRITTPEIATTTQRALHTRHRPACNDTTWIAAPKKIMTHTHNGRCTRSTARPATTNMGHCAQDCDRGPQRGLHTRRLSHCNDTTFTRPGPPGPKIATRPQRALHTGQLPHCIDTTWITEARDCAHHPTCQCAQNCDKRAEGATHEATPVLPRHKIDPRGPRVWQTHDGRCMRPHHNGTT